jgi:hypothetical protein
MTYATKKQIAFENGFMLVIDNGKSVLMRNNKRSSKFYNEDVEIFRDGTAIHTSQLHEKHPDYKKPTFSFEQ